MIIKDTKILFASGILGVSFIASTLIGGAFFLSARSEGTLSVTGSARMSVTSDKAKWTGNWMRKVTLKTLKDGYASMDKDQKAVTDFLASKGIASSEIVMNPVSMEEVYSYDNKDAGAEKQYTLRQYVVVASTDVAKITAIANATRALVDKGVVFSTNNPEYYYSDLATLRVSLLGGAIKDAKARAEMIANAGGKVVGNLVSAASGVVQVLPADSVDVSDYGTYDVSSKNKEVMVTVKAAFTLK